MLFRVAAATLVAIFASHAGAQEAPSPKPISITVQTSMTFAGSTATAEDQSALQAKARTAVYQVAASECAVISEALNVDCRLGQIQVSSRPIDQRQGANGISAEGRFTFLVNPR